MCILCCRSVPPQIHHRTSSPSHIEARVSETAVIKCHVTGIPVPTVRWLVNGRPIDRTDQRYYIRRDGATLRITDLRVTDTGQYTCVASNSVGVAQTDFNLDVLGIELASTSQTGFGRSIICMNFFPMMLENRLKWQTTDNHKKPS